MKKFFPLIILILLSAAFFSCQEETLPCQHTALSSQVFEPTCDAEGYTVNTCTECKKQFRTAYTAPTGHTMSETLFAPTCTEEGYTYYACACGYSYRSQSIPPIGHTFDTLTVEVSCEVAGYTEYTCSVCNYKYVGNYVDAIGHELTSLIHLPTRDAAGYTEHVCSLCDHSYKDEFVFYSDVYGGGEIANTEILTKGIDVSVYQHSRNADNTYRPLDWNAIREAGVEFAILKVGSKNGMDPVFEMNYEDARAAGVKLGAYFYCYATTEEELQNEIQLLLNWIEGKQFEYPIYFDLEDPTLEDPEKKDMLTSFCMTFVDSLRDNGYYGALYSNEKWLANYLHRDLLRAYCDVWYARYPSSEKVNFRKEYSWNFEKYGDQLGMWQYTQTGLLTDCGIAPNQTVDFNYCYKDYESIIKKYGLNGYSIESEIENEPEEENKNEAEIEDDQ